VLKADDANILEERVSCPADVEQGKSENLVGKTVRLRARVPSKEADMFRFKWKIISVNGDSKSESK
jgi:hypothetical protein